MGISSLFLLALTIVSSSCTITFGEWPATPTAPQNLSVTPYIQKSLWIYTTPMPTGQQCMYDEYDRDHIECEAYIGEWY